MNKQELIGKYEYLNHDCFRRVDTSEVLKDLKQLDEPQPVEVPKFVADWIETAKKATGLKDKNGKEIFEGDIVDYKGRKAVIKWHGSYASFIYRFVDELQERVSEWHPLFLAYYHFEVIGNIYENKELLEVEE